MEKMCNTETDFDECPGTHVIFTIDARAPNTQPGSRRLC